MDKKLFEQFLSSFKLLSNSDNIDNILLSEGRKENARSVASNLSDEQFEVLLNGDPSKDSPQNAYKYIEWMARQAKAGFNINQIIELTKLYDDNLQLIPKENPIQNFKTLKDLYSFISALDTEEYRHIRINADTEEHNQKVESYIKAEQDNFHVIEDTDEYIVSRVLNPIGSCKLGKEYRARWCLAGGDAAGGTYNVIDAANYYKNYINTGNILYFIMFKNIDMDAAAKAYAVIINVNSFNDSTRTFEVSVASIHNRKDTEVGKGEFNNQFKKPAFDAAIKDAKTNGSANLAYKTLITIKTPEELKAGLDKYSKILDKESFKLLTHKLESIIDANILKQAGIRADSLNPLKKVYNTISKGTFTTKNISSINLESIGESFNLLNDTSFKYSANLSYYDIKHLYDEMFNSFYNYTKSITPTQYVFMLNKAMNINIDDISSNSNKKDGIFYSLIVPLLTFEVLENNIKFHFNSTESGVFKSIFINGVNNKLLYVLKKELLKKSNTKLRNFFSKYSVNSYLPQVLKNDENDKTVGHPDSGIHLNMRSFLLANDNQYPLLHIRQVYREIIDTISKIPYGSVTVEEVGNILDYTIKDIRSVNTDESREKFLQNFRAKTPNLLQSLKATFPARKKYIKTIYDNNLSNDFYNKKIYDYDPISKRTTDHTAFLLKHKYYYTTGMNSSELLLGLNREEINDYLDKNHDIALSNYNQNSSIFNLANYIIFLSGHGGKPPEGMVLPDNVYESFRGLGIQHYSSLDMDCILNLNGPENGNYTEKNRINFAIYNFYENPETLDFIPNFIGGRKLSNGKKLTPEEMNETLNKSSDAIHDTVLQQLYISEEKHYSSILENIRYFFENPEKIENVKNGSKVLKKAIEHFSLLIIRKMQVYLKLATLMQKSVILTSQYGSPEKKQRLNPIIKQMFEEKTNNYKQIIERYLELLVSNNISNIKLPETAIKFPSMYGIVATKAKASAIPLRKSIEELEKLVSKLDSGNSAINENKKIFVRFYK